MAKESRRMPTAQGVSFVFKTHYFSSIPLFTSLANLISSFRYEGAFELPFLIYSYAHLISSFRYEGAYKNGEAHGQGIETRANGYRFFSPFKDSFPPFHLSCDINFFF